MLATHRKMRYSPRKRKHGANPRKERSRTTARPSEVKLRHCVYISKEAHSIVSKIVNTIADKEITVGGYIDTVLMRHFEENKDEINNLYRRNRDNLI